MSGALCKSHRAKVVGEPSACEMSELGGLAACARPRRIARRRLNLSPDERGQSSYGARAARLLPADDRASGQTGHFWTLIALGGGRPLAMSLIWPAGRWPRRARATLRREWREPRGERINQGRLGERDRVPRNASPSSGSAAPYGATPSSPRPIGPASWASLRAGFCARD